MSTEKELREVFKPIHDLLMERDIDDPELFRLIAEIAQDAPNDVYGFSMHVSDLLNEMYDTGSMETTVSQIAAEAYYRTYIDPATGAMYSTNYFNGDLAKIKLFVDDFMAVQNSMDTSHLFIGMSSTVH